MERRMVLLYAHTSGNGPLHLHPRADVVIGSDFVAAPQIQTSHSRSACHAVSCPAGRHFYARDGCISQQLQLQGAATSPEHVDKGEVSARALYDRHHRHGFVSSRATVISSQVLLPLDDHGVELDEEDGPVGQLVRGDGVCADLAWERCRLHASLDDACYKRGAVEGA